MSYADWHTLGEVSYRKFPVYETMGWGDSIQIEDYKLYGSIFGGPLAMMKINRKSAHKGTTVKNTLGEAISTLCLYTSAGIEIATIEWEKMKIVGMGWSDREELAVVSEDGECASKCHLWNEECNKIDESSAHRSPPK